MTVDKQQQFEKAYAFYREHIGMNGRSVLSEEQGEVVTAIMNYANEQIKEAASEAWDAGERYAIQFMTKMNTGGKTHIIEPEKEDYLKKYQSI